MATIILKSKDKVFNGMKINLKEAINNKTILTEEISKTDMVTIEKMVDKKLEDKIKEIVTKEIKNNSTEKMVTDIVKNCLVQLYKQLWTKRTFWMSGIVNKPN